TLDKDKVPTIHNMGISIVNWSVDSMDWSGLSVSEIIKLIRKEVYPGGIILQHSAGGKNGNLDNTIQALNQMIPELRSQGYTFVTVPELLNIPASLPQTAVLPN
ncbi:polysaccharide deacetylase, partial [Paenibacillus sp. TAF58]